MDDTLCPFSKWLKWLEAVSCDVDHCAAHFDDGPDSMHFEWQSRILRIEVWERAAHRRFSAGKLDGKQVAVACYAAFRNFVQSREYDPVSYEQDVTEMDFAQSAIRGRLTPGELIGFLTALDAAALEFFIRFVSLIKSYAPSTPRGWGADRQWTAPPLLVLQSTFRGVMSETEIADVYRRLMSRDAERGRQIVPELWDRLDAIRRRDRLAEMLAHTIRVANGSKLRTLKSPRLESLMALGTAPRGDVYAGHRTIST